MQKLVIAASIILISIFHATTAWAVGCSATASNTTGAQGNIINYRFSNNTVAIDRNAPVGSIVWTRSFNTMGSKWYCNSGASRFYESKMGARFAQVVGTNYRGNIYATGVEGLGIQVTDLYAMNKSVGYRMPLSGTGVMSFENKNYTRIDIIKYAPIGEGELATGELAKFTIDGVKVMSIYMTSINLKNKSCTLDGSLTRNIPLGSFTKKQVNPTSTDVPFEMNLMCSADAIPVYVQFDPLHGSSGRGELNLDTSMDEHATGVVVEVLDGNTHIPLEFAKEKQYHTNNETAISIPLIARYKKKGADITPGVANAGMTITINER